MALGEVRMNSDFRVSVDFFAHHKTKKLRRRLGYEGVVALLQLWAYAARVRPDGDLSGMEDEDIELAVDWCGEEGTLVPTLKSVGFLDEDEGGLRLHDWQENNAWAAAGESRSDASRLSRMAKVFPDEYQALVGAGIRGVSKRDYEALRTSNDRWAVIDGMIRGCRRAGGDAQGADNDQTTVVNEARTVVERSLTTVERPFDDDLSPPPRSRGGGGCADRDTPTGQPSPVIRLTEGRDEPASGTDEPQGQRDEPAGRRGCLLRR